MQHTTFSSSPDEHHSPSLMPQTAAGPNSNGYHTAQQAAPDSNLAKHFVWLGNCPTCSQCGDRGHEARSCSTSYCDHCSKWGHPPGDCSSACITCGKIHKSKSCIPCKQCGMFGHLGTMCPTMQCSKCMSWGHAGIMCIVPQPKGTSPEAAWGASNSSTSDPAAAWALPQSSQPQHAPAGVDRLQAGAESPQPPGIQPQEPPNQPAQTFTSDRQGQLAASRVDGYTTGPWDPATDSGSVHDNQQYEYQQPQYQQQQRQHYTHLQSAQAYVHPATGHSPQHHQQQQYHQQPAAVYHSGGPGEQPYDYRQQHQQHQQQYGTPMQAPPPPPQQQQPPQQPHQQQERASNRSSRSYSWLAKIPTCWACGDRGHSADSCPAAVCGACGKVGHAEGLCEQHCAKCGKQHTGRGCKQCKMCGMFGHLSTMCFDAHCKACDCYGHTQQDCPSVCKCGYPTPHSPAECPGLCTRCLQYGHTSRDCSAQQCPRCEQWGQGCTDTQCRTPGATVAAAAAPTVAAAGAGARTAAAAPAAAPPHGYGVQVAAVERSSSSSPTRAVPAAAATAAAGVPRSNSSSPPLQSSYMDTYSSNSSAGVSRSGPNFQQAHTQQQVQQQVQQQAQQHAQGCVRIDGKTVYLEQLTDEEDLKRRTSFCNWLIDSPRPEFKAFGVLLIDQPSKLAALIRVPRAIMTQQVLPSPDAVQRMEDICTQCLGSSSNNSSSSRAGNGADSSNAGDANHVPAGQQLLPEHCAELEASLPPGMLPSNWRALSFREIEDQLVCRTFKGPVEAKGAWRKAKAAAKAKTAAAKAAGQQHNLQQAAQLSRRQPAAQQGPQAPSQPPARAQTPGTAQQGPQQGAQPSSTLQGQQQPAGQQIGRSGSGNAAASSSSAAVAAELSRTHSPAHGAAWHVNNSSRGSACSSPQPSARSTAPAATPPSSFSPAKQPGGSPQLLPLLPDNYSLNPATVVLEPSPPPKVASQRREQLAELLLTHPNGDLHDYGLQLVGDDAKFGVLIRVPWPVLEWCMRQKHAGTHLDAVAKHCSKQAAQAASPAPQQQGMRQRVVEQQQGPGLGSGQQQHQYGVQLVVQEVADDDSLQSEGAQADDGEWEVWEDSQDDAEVVQDIAINQQGQQQQQQVQAEQPKQQQKSRSVPVSPKQQDSATQQQVQQQQQQDSGEGIKPCDLLPEYAAALEAEFGLKEGWMEATSWRQLDNKFLPRGLGKAKDNKAPKGRVVYRVRRRELQALTAAQLAAAGSSGSNSSSSLSVALVASCNTGSGSGSRTKQYRDYRELLLGLKLRDPGSAEQDALAVANTTTQLCASLPEYMQSLLASNDAGVKLSFLSKLLPEDLDKVLRQDSVPPSEVLDGLYEQYRVMQGSGELGVAGKASGDSKMRRVGAGCRQS